MKVLTASSLIMLIHSFSVPLKPPGAFESPFEQRITTRLRAFHVIKWAVRPLTPFDSYLSSSEIRPDVNNFLSLPHLLANPSAVLGQGLAFECICSYRLR